MQNYGMKKSLTTVRAFKIVFALMLCGVLLPWFDRGGDTPFFWGFEVLMEHYLWIPFALLILFIWVFHGKTGIAYIVFTEAAFAGVLGIYIYSILYFKRYLWTIYESDAEMDLRFGLSCATAGFWIAAFLAAVAFVWFQWYLYRNAKEGDREIGAY